jgi:hypothetical protein
MFRILTQEKMLKTAGLKSISNLGKYLNALNCNRNEKQHESRKK